jgi:5'-nucleotidase
VKKRLYVDMDGTLVDYRRRLAGVAPEVTRQFGDHADQIPGLYALMPPMPGALEAFTELAGLFDAYVLSTAPWSNPSAWTDKLIWVQLHFGKGADSPAYKRLVLSHHKNLQRGDFLVDDRPDLHGVGAFPGEVLHFGSEHFPDWPHVMPYLRARA